MNGDREREAASFISGLVLGAVIGAGLAMLTAPQPGRMTRRRLKRSARRLTGDAADRFDELAVELRDKVDEAVGQARERLTG